MENLSKWSLFCSKRLMESSKNSLHIFEHQHLMKKERMNWIPLFCQLMSWPCCDINFTTITHSIQSKRYIACCDFLIFILPMRKLKGYHKISIPRRETYRFLYTLCKKQCLTWPCPSEMELNLLLPNPLSSANFSRAMVGSAPGDRTKISGAQQLESA